MGLSVDSVRMYVSTPHRLVKLSNVSLRETEKPHAKK